MGHRNATESNLMISMRCYLAEVNHLNFLIPPCFLSEHVDGGIRIEHGESITHTLPSFLLSSVLAVIGPYCAMRNKKHSSPKSHSAHGHTLAEWALQWSQIGSTAWKGGTLDRHSH